MTFFSGGAGLSGTASDYAKFLQMYLYNGEYAGTRLLSRTTVNFMMQNQMGDLRGDGSSDYGLAFGLIDEDGEARGNGSEGVFFWGGYFNTSYFADPNENVIGIFLNKLRGQPAIKRVGSSSKWFSRQLATSSLY